MNGGAFRWLISLILCVANAGDAEDPPSVTYTVSPTAFSESVGSAIIRITRDGGFSEVVTFYLSTIGVTASAGEDYVELVRYQASLAANEQVQLVIIAISSDTVPESDETFKLKLDTFSTDQEDIDVLITITDDDSPPVSVTYQSFVQVYESDTNIEPLRVTFTRSDASLNPLNIQVQSVPDSAKAGEDFETISKSVTLNENAGSFYFDITLLDDFVTEEQESFTITVTSDGLQNSPLTITVTILDDDKAVDFNCNRGSSQLCKNGGTCNIDGTCSCTAEYMVENIPDCSVKLDLVAGCDDRCGDSGICFTDGETTECACLPGITGDRCTKNAYYAVCQTDGIYVCITPYSVNTFGGKVFINGFPGCTLDAGQLAGQDDVCAGYAGKFLYTASDCGMIGPTDIGGNTLSYNLDVIVQYTTLTTLSRLDELVPITCQFDNNGILVYASSNIRTEAVTSNHIGKRVRGGDFSPAGLELTYEGSEITTPIFFGEIITLCASVEDSDFVTIILKKVTLNNTKSDDNAKQKDIYVDGCGLEPELLGAPYWKDNNKHTVCASVSPSPFPNDAAPYYLGLVVTFVVTNDDDAAMMVCEERQKRDTQQTTGQSAIKTEQVQLGRVIIMMESTTETRSGNNTGIEVATTDTIMPIVIIASVGCFLVLLIVLVVIICIFRRRSPQKDIDTLKHSY